MKWLLLFEEKVSKWNKWSDEVWGRLRSKENSGGDASINVKVEVCKAAAKIGKPALVKLK